MKIYTQVELEQLMVDCGRKRAEESMAANEAAGRASDNRYASPLFRRFIDPLAFWIKTELDSLGRPGRHRGYLKLMMGVEPEVVAYLSVRYMVNTLLADSSDKMIRKKAHDLGKLVQDEQVLRQYEAMAPEQAAMLQRLLNKRASSNVRHRMILAKRGMNDLCIDPIDWGPGARDQVGAALINGMRQTGLIELWTHTVLKRGRPHTETAVGLTPEAMGLLGSMRDLVIENTPYFLPCVEPPRRWNGKHGGGYHTPPMRRRAPCCVVKHSGDDWGNLEVLNKAMNTLQEVPWRINTQVLDIAKELSKIRETKEVLSLDFKAMPEKPGWLDDTPKEQMTPEQVAEFKAWKRAMADGYTENNMRRSRFGRMTLAFQVATMLRDQPELYFVYFADSRSRVYPYTTGISPQGSDLQKALLEFARGEPLDTIEAQNHFYRAGANRWGFDKVSEQEQIQWVVERHQMLMDMAANPLDILDWLEADSPYQFLAWALEYRQFHLQGKDFLSRIACGMDGSCNGLQNFSALLRDEVGGVHTNLVPSAKPNDIYSAVAAVTKRRVDESEDGPLKRLWQAHGVNRKITKRSVMTLVYGSKKHSSKGFILNDYLREVETGFPADMLKDAAGWLNERMWPAIGEVVVKARQAMDWFQKASSAILKVEPHIQWATPTGFKVCQDYRKMESLGVVRIRLTGLTQWKLSGYGDKPDKVAHRNGIAPNFVHSLDASHMQFVASAAKDAGIHSVAMIHDDFGCHARFAEKFATIIRETFVKMYLADDWMERFAEFYRAKGIELPPMPKKGKLDITVVLSSKYFFC